MSTDSEVLAAGYPLPSGDDMLNQGDDAIRQLSHAAYDDGRYLQAGTPLTSGNVDTLPGGTWTVPDRATALLLSGLPVVWPGILRVFGRGAARFQTYAPAYVGNTSSNGADHALLYVRRTDQAGSWRPWQPVPTGTPPGTRQGELRLADMRRRVGPVTVTTPAAVTIVMDHGLTNVKDKVLPLLRARGLTATLAINSGRWSDPANSGATPADVKTWADVFEVANHGRNHLLTGNPADDRVEVEDGRTQLEAQLGVPIDTWVQTGNGPVGSYPFDDGRSAEAYWTTETGRIIARSHAVWTGMLPVPAGGYPLDGQPSPGAQGTWIDTGTSGAQAAITAAITAGDRGVIVRLHPQYLDSAGYLTTAQLAAFLDWLVTRRNAGDLTVLTYRQWSLARRSEAVRDTGRRNVIPLFTTTPSGGTATLQRVGHTCLLNIMGLTFPAAGSSTVAVLPSGFLPAETVGTTMRGVTNIAQITAAGNLQIFNWSQNARIDGSLMWISRDPWPSSLPGIPA